MTEGQAAPTGAWRTATVRSVTHPSPLAVVLRLEVPDRIDHWPGQHYAIRLTADDGYVAQRSYSIASAPSDPLLEFYIERLPDGEVSGFLAEVVEPGDELEIRGPIGGWFVWRAETPGLGIGGGSGAVPLVSMMRHAIAVDRPRSLRLAVSARRVAAVPYLDELTAFGATVAITAGPAGSRLDADRLAPLLPEEGPVLVCGSTRFAAGVGELVTQLGLAPDRLRVEQFGFSG